MVFFTFISVMLLSDGEATKSIATSAIVVVCSTLYVVRK